jgi:hypothetical protein
MPHKVSSGAFYFPYGQLHEAIVMRGQRAWSAIKRSASEQRQMWREVGDALAYGRALHRADKAFGAWVVEAGFGDMDRKSRTVADLPPTPELTIEAPTKLTASIEQVAPQAKTINKLAKMAELYF